MLPKNFGCRLSSEQYEGEVWIEQIDRKRVPTFTSEVQRLQKFCRWNCGTTHASRNFSWPQRAPSIVGHEAAIICQGMHMRRARYTTGEHCRHANLNLNDSQFAFWSTLYGLRGNVHCSFWSFWAQWKARSYGSVQGHSEK